MNPASEGGGPAAHHAGRFADAAAEFQRFLDAPGVAESPVNRAAVEQLLGASLLPDRLQTKSAWQAFTNAIAVTPYDPDVYMVRSVACVGLGRAADPAAERARTGRGARASIRHPAP